MSAHGVGPLLLLTAARLVDGCHSRFLLGRGTRTRPLRLLTSPYLPPIQRPLYSRLCRPRLRPCDSGSRAWGLRVVLNDSVVSSIACVSQHMAAPAAASATNAIERLRESSKIERLRYLWSSAQQHPGMPDLQRILLLGLDRLAAHDEAPLPNRARQRCCGKCFVPLVPGFNSRVTQSRHPRRPSARRCVFRVHCESCGHANAFPKVAPPSSRSSSKPPATAPSPKSTKSRKPASPILPSKKRRVQPAPAPAPAPAGDGFFGFDFVPLLGS
jgi:RNase P subunit RPR2